MHSARNLALAWIRPGCSSHFISLRSMKLVLSNYEAAADEYSAGRYQWQVTESTFNVRRICESFDAATKDNRI